MKTIVIILLLAVLGVVVALPQLATIAHDTFSAGASKIEESVGSTTP